MVGVSIGAAIMGLRPVVELMFGDLLPSVMMQLVQQAANVRYMTAGRATAPIVVRVKVGDGPYRAHPQSFEGLFMHVPGLKVVFPSTPREGKALVKSALRGTDPVLFFEHIYLYRGIREEVPDGEATLPLGVADVKREGQDVSVVTYGRMVHRALAAAARLAKEGISVEVLDLRTIMPPDLDAIYRTVSKTGRVAFVQEAWKVGGVGAELAAQVSQTCFGMLQAPVVRLGAPHIPIPFATQLRDRSLVGVDQIVNACRWAKTYAPPAASRA